MTVPHRPHPLARSWTAIAVGGLAVAFLLLGVDSPITVPAAVAEAAPAVVSAEPAGGEGVRGDALFRSYVGWLRDAHTAAAAQPTGTTELPDQF
jgi:hypothetical protein